MERAFAGGYDPALELAQHSNRKAEDAGAAELDELDELTFDGLGAGQLTASGHLRRREQDWIDRIVHGAETGHYYVLLGPKVRSFYTYYYSKLMYIIRVLERRP